MVPKVLEGPIRKLFGIPEDAFQVEVYFNDNVYGSDWGCDTCGYGAPDDELEVRVDWIEDGKVKSVEKSYTGYSRLSDFFKALDEA